jgi:hypothetical protein
MKNRTSKKKMNVNIHSARETGTERYITVARRKQYFSESAIIKAIGASLLIYQMYVLNPLDMGIKTALVAIFAKTLYFLISSGVWLLYFDKTSFVTKSERKVIKQRRLKMFIGAFVALLAYIGVSISKYFIESEVKKSGGTLNTAKISIPKVGEINLADIYALIYGTMFMAI